MENHSGRPLWALLIPVVGLVAAAAFTLLALLGLTVISPLTVDHVVGIVIGLTLIWMVER